MPGSTQQAVFDGASASAPSLRQRFVQLRRQARRDAQFTRVTMTLCSLVLMLFCAAGVVLVVYLLASGAGKPWGGQSWAIIIPWFEVAVFMAFSLFLLFVSITVQRLYTYHYRQAWRNLLFRDLAVLIADDSFYQLINEQLSQYQFIVSRRLPKRQTVEQYLELNCVFARSLSAIAKCKTQKKIDGLNSQGWICYKSSWLFQPRWRNCVGCIGGNLLAVGIFLPHTLAWIVATGQGFIASRAVLVAFLDFMLEEPPPWVDELKPPENVKRPWWWRSIAPLLKG